MPRRAAPCQAPRSSDPSNERSVRAPRAALLQGTLDLLVLRNGSLYPALQQLEARGWIRAAWGASANNRGARSRRHCRALAAVAILALTVGIGLTTTVFSIVYATSASTYRSRRTARASSPFMDLGFIALFLASVGLYAVMAFSVSRRTRKVGIRMALGAEGGDVVRMVFGQGLAQLAIGMAVGLALALGISRVVSIILFDVQPRDPVVLGSVVGVLILAGPA